VNYARTKWKSGMCWETLSYQGWEYVLCVRLWEGAPTKLEINVGRPHWTGNNLPEFSGYSEKAVIETPTSDEVLVAAIGDLRSAYHAHIENVRSAKASVERLFACSVEIRRGVGVVTATTHSGDTIVRDATTLSRLTDLAAEYQEQGALVTMSIPEDVPAEFWTE